jgi:hypothetical protein
MRPLLALTLTLAACDEPASTCSYADATYAVGDRFPATDGCNTCECVDSSGGEPTVSCTEMACG